MELDGLPYDRQPEFKRTAMRFRVALPKQFEDMRQEVGADPFASIGDRNLRARVRWMRIVPAPACELDGIR